MDIWQKLNELDRRWIYFLMFLSILFPTIFVIKFPVELTPEAEQLYNAVEALPDSSVVMLTFDYYASAMAETEPMSIAALRHMWRKNMKIVTLTNIPLGGPTIAERITRQVAKEFGKVYGVDYVNLGYKANYVAVMHGLAGSIESIFPTDYSGTRLSELPLMQKVKTYADIKFLYCVADNATADYWISIVNAQYGLPVGAGVTAVMAPKMYAFVEAGQMTGLLGGMKGAAEYEKLVGAPGSATRGMDAQSMAHFLIIFLVMVGNLGFFLTKKKRKV